MKKKLPKRTEEHKLQAASFQFLEGNIDLDLFILRRDQSDDYGVDCRLEIVVDQFPTNIHIFAQLKGHRVFIRTNETIKQDIDVSTLEYLLAQPNSIVIGYSDKEKLLYYTVVSEGALSAINHKWRKQTTLRLTLDRRFSQEAQKNLHDEAVRRNGELQILNAACDRVITQGKPELVSIDPDGIGTDEYIAEQLKANGHQLVNKGRLPEVRKLLQRLSKNTLDTDLHLILIQAHFYVNEGNSTDALACIAKYRRLPDEQKTQESVRFIQLMELVLQRAQGKKADLSLEGIKSLIEDPNCLGALPLVSNVIRRKVLEQAITPEVGLSEIDKLESKLDVLEDLDKQAIRYQIQADRLAIEATKVVHKLTSLLVERLTRESMGIRLAPPNASDEIGQVTINSLEVVRKYGELIEQSGSIGSSFVAEALYEYVHILAGMKHLILRITTDFPEIGIDKQPVVKGMLAHLVQLDICQKYWENIGDYLRSTAVLKLKYFIFHTLGNKDGEKESSSEFVNRVKKYSLTELQDDIEEVDGEQRLKPIVDIQVLNDDTDFRTIKAEEFAEHIMRSLGLPQDRFQAVLHECEALVHIEQQKWIVCRHLELRSKNQPKEPRLMYLKKADFKVLCNKFHHISKVSNDDISLVSRLFEENHCNGCPARSPKQ